MAGLTHNGREGNRAQLLLAGAFVLAVALIGLSIVLTSSSYTTTLANQETEITRGSDAISVRKSLEHQLTRQFEHVYETYDARSARENEFQKVVPPIGNETTTHYAQRGRMVNVTMDASGAGFIDGTRIKQGVSSDFEDPQSDNSDWFPAENVELRNATFMVTDVPETDPTEAFNLSFDTPAAAGGNWSVALYSDSSTGEFTVRTRSPDGTLRKCTRPDVRASGVQYEIDLDAGTIDGTTCRALTPIDPGRDKYDLNITNGDRAFGKYWMIVDEAPISSNIDSFSVGLIDAQTEGILYGARVRYRYHSATVSYETNIDIAPDEIA